MFTENKIRSVFAFLFVLAICFVVVNYSEVQKGERIGKNGIQKDALKDRKISIPKNKIRPRNEDSPENTFCTAR
ncbi:hypothetical protein HME9304_01362 [Flagellimonas maritima]|uniref:Uncharacterized protein n=1 Tax=Flagellimonas maritima TaxID=1383885 RepID=A0A2Z4LRG4_9FLAO|nr:hypothetical protein HME9304_01362 [Allomuricauda aurantiaca]